jgi:glycosyltransferase involved in cell wall biosynthesis
MDRNLEVQLSDIKETDLLVGIPSYNNIRTIRDVVQAVTTGLKKYFPKAKAILVIADGGSSDGTQDEVKKIRMENIKRILLSYPVHPVHKVVVPYHGIPGKGTAFRTVLEIAESLNVGACALVDSDLRSITPEWMELLLRPVYEEGFDYVAPIYARHKFDGTITNGIVYPLMRALYGNKVRQPIAGDFGFSGNLAKFYLTKDIWDTDVVLFGMDIWVTTLAMAGGYNLCQSHLGPRFCDTKEASDLGSIFTQVVSPVYALMEDNQVLWKGIKGSKPVPTFGSQKELGIESVTVHVERMIQSFRLGARNLMEIWRRAVPSETALWLESIARLSDEAFAFPQDLWARIVYDFAVAYHGGFVHREHLLKSMIPLYLGWVASFVKGNQDKTASEAEEYIESLCRLFEEMKPYLIERWT